MLLGLGQGNKRTNERVSNITSLGAVSKKSYSYIAHHTTETCRIEVASIHSIDIDDVLGTFLSSFFFQRAVLKSRGVCGI